MESDVVIAGRYAKCRVSCNARYNYIFIKNGREQIPIVADDITSYELKSEFKGSLSRNKSVTYNVEWRDGGKSVVRIPKIWEDIFISGCEAGALDEKTAKKHSFGQIFGLAFFIAALMGIIVLMFSPFLNKDSSNRINPGRLTYGEWSDVSIYPNGSKDVYLYVDPGYTGYFDETDGQYYIKGRLYNNTNKVLERVWLEFGLYDINGTKVGTCTAKLQFKLRPEGVWNYGALCLEWPEGNEYRIDSIEVR